MTQDNANHDAVPAAIARTDADRNRTDKAAIRPGKGAGNTHPMQTTPGECSLRNGCASGRETVRFASDGSVAGEPVAWIAVLDGDDADGEFVWPDKGRAIKWASTRPGVRIAPLYLQPQRAVVRLPPLDPNGAPGWNAAIGAVREALAKAGVDWDTE